MKSIGIGREALPRRRRLSWRLRVLWLWARGRSSIDGRSIYLPVSDDPDDDV